MPKKWAVDGPTVAAAVRAGSAAEVARLCVDRDADVNYIPTERAEGVSKALTPPLGLAAQRLDLSTVRALLECDQG